MTFKITEVEVKHHLLAFEMRVVRGLYYPTHIKGYIQKAKTIANRLYIYTKRDTLCKKQDNLRYVFIQKNPDSLRYEILHEIFEMGIYICLSVGLVSESP